MNSSYYKYKLTYTNPFNGILETTYTDELICPGCGAFLKKKKWDENYFCNCTNIEFEVKEYE